MVLNDGRHVLINLSMVIHMIDTGDQWLVMVTAVLVVDDGNGH